jgi:uncharacterized protein
MTNWINYSNSWLQEKDIAFIQSAFSQYPSISRVRLFGSRAKGNYTNRSDIDVAYEGEIDHRAFSEIWSSLTYDAPFLYKCDIVDYNSLSPSLKEHIDRVGKILV